MYLYPKNDAARKVFSHKDNRSYFVSGSFNYLSTADDESERGEDRGFDSDSSEDDSEPFLFLSVNKFPKRLFYGWLFGSNKKL